MGRHSLQEIFCHHSPDYERMPQVPAHQRKAARAIMQCRTAALGGHVPSCPDGHMSRIWYHSCRHRSWPQWAFIQSERWLLKQQTRLLACDHSHVIFTVPPDRNPLGRLNLRAMPGLWCQSVRATLMAWLGAPQDRGGATRRDAGLAPLGANVGVSPARASPGPWWWLPFPGRMGWGPQRLLTAHPCDDGGVPGHVRGGRASLVAAGRGHVT